MSDPLATYDEDFDDPIQVVRFRIQDTDVSVNADGVPQRKFTDAEIAYQLGASGDDIDAASLSLVLLLKARAAELVDTTDGELKVAASQMYDHYADLAAALSSPISAGGSGGAVPYAGHVSVADVMARQANRDRPFGRFEQSVRGVGGARLGGWW